MRAISLAAALVLVVLALAAAVARAAGPAVSVVDAFIGLGNVAGPTTLTPTVLLDAGAASATPLYLVGVDLSGNADLTGFTAVLPTSSTPASTAPGATAILSFDLAPIACPPSPQPQPGFYRVFLEIAATPTPSGPSDITRVRTVLVMQDRTLGPRGADWCGPRRVFSIMQDGGPTPASAPGGTTAVATALFNLGVPATFFLTGLNPNAADRCARAQALVAQGHTIGSLTYAYLDLPTLSDDELIADLVRNDEWIFDCVSQRPRILRPPFGNLQPRQTQLLASIGFTVAMWRFRIDDITVASAAQTLQAFTDLDTASLAPGPLQSFISDGHDYSANIVRILQGLVPHYTNLGYTFATVQDCIDLCGSPQGLCKDPAYPLGGLATVWRYTGSTPDPRTVLTNPTCVTAGSDAAPAPPASATPPAAPPLSTQCVLTTGGSLVVEAPTVGTQCVVVYDELYSYLAETVVTGGHAVFAASAIGTASAFVVEGYGSPDCAGASFTDFYYCAAVCNSTSNCVPTGPAPTTPAPTVTAGPPACVILADNSLVVGLPFANTRCLIVYDGSYKTLAGQRTIANHATFSSALTYTTQSYIVEGYSGASCANNTFINFLTCTAASNATGPTSAPVPPPPTCKVASDGSLSVVLPFTGSQCVVLYDGTYTYLAATAANASDSTQATFLPGARRGTDFYVEGYATAGCTGYIGFVPCSTNATLVVTPGNGNIPVFTYGEDAALITGVPFTVPKPAVPYNVRRGSGRDRGGGRAKRGGGGWGGSVGGVGGLTGGIEGVGVGVGVDVGVAWGGGPGAWGGGLERVRPI